MYFCCSLAQVVLLLQFEKLVCPSFVFRGSPYVESIKVSFITEKPAPSPPATSPLSSSAHAPLIFRFPSVSCSHLLLPQDFIGSSRRGNIWLSSGPGTFTRAGTVRPVDQPPPPMDGAQALVCVVQYIASPS